MKPVFKLIADRGFNDDELAMRIGMSGEELRYSLNQGKQIDVLTAYKLSQVLNVTLDYLYPIL